MHNEYTVLAINDNPEELNSLQAVLRQAGYRVLIADSGKYGFELAERELPDLIISQAVMSNGDGLELCRSVRAANKLRQTPILFLSRAGKGNSGFLEAIENGADDCLEMPYEQLHLIAAASRLIGRGRMSDALRDSENHFRNLIENSRDIISIIASDGTINYESPAIEHVLGYKPEELIGKNAFDFIHPDESAEVLAFFNRALQKQTRACSTEYRFRHKDNSWRILESVGKRFVDSVEGRTAIVNSRDVTEQRKALQAQSESENRLQTIFRNAAIGMCLVNSEGFCMQSNPALRQMLGYTKKEFQQLSYVDVTHPEDLLNEQKFVTELFAGKRHNYQLEKRYIKKNGATMWGNLTAFSVRNYAGEIEFAVAMVEDITARKSAEKKLRDSREHLSLAQQVAKIGSFELNLQTYAATTSSELRTLYDMPPDDFEGKFEDRIGRLHPEDAAKAKQTLDAALVSGKYNSEFRILRKDGAVSWICGMGKIFYDEADAPARLVGVNMDITDRKQAESSLNFQRILLEAQSEASIDGILVVTPNGEIISHNQQFVNMWEIPADVLATKNDESVLNFVLDKLSNPQEFLQKVSFLYQQPGLTDHTEVSLKDGRIFERYSAPVLDADKISLGRIWHFRDITERKQTEEKLRDSEERYRLLFESNPLPMWVYSLETLRFLAVNTAAILHYGYSREEFLSMTIKDIRSPEDIPALLEKVASVNGGFSAGGLWKHIKKNGDAIDVEITSHEVVFADGRAELVLVNDVTERKKAEDSIRFQAHLLDTVEQAVIATDCDGVVIYWNRFAQKLYGWSAAEAVGRNITSLTTPEIAREKAAQIISRLRDGEGWSGEFIVSCKNGQTFPAKVFNTPVFNDSNEVIGIIGVSFDITEYKESEKTIRESEARFRLLCEAAPLGVFLADAGGRCLFTNSYLQSVAGFSFEEALGEGFANFIHPDDRDEAFQEWMETAAVGKECFQQYRFMHPDNTIRWVSIRSVPIFTSDGQFTSHVGAVEDITERRRSEEALRQAEVRYRNLVELSPAIVYLAEPYPPYAPIYVSPNVEVFGYRSEEWFSRDDMWLNLIHEDDRERVLSNTKDAMRQGHNTEIEYRIVARNGQIHSVHDKGCFISDEQGNTIGWQGVILDITETKKLEEQLRLSQKLESVGRLAGGIAHDFNNMLTAINGYSGIILRQLGEDHPLRPKVQEIKKAGERSAALTHQLLAFSRQQILKPKILNINEVIVDTSNMLQRLIGEDIQLNILPNLKVGQVEVDPNQLTQVVVNLAVNARDAMPNGGNLTFETANVYLDEETAALYAPTQPGSYVLLSVSDTGSGMSDDTQQHIFEPFYTTKEVGKGTGLGLATVYGIIKQSNGYIWVDSEIGKGTTFKIYFPRADKQSIHGETDNQVGEVSRGSETILLVEDEEVLRNLAREILETCGYTVIEAKNGLEALEICQNLDYKIDLLITDVVMPKMGGREAAKKIAEIYPDIPQLFISGYTNDDIFRQGIIKENVNFIQKPFTFETLAYVTRKLLDLYKP